MAIQQTQVDVARKGRHTTDLDTLTITTTDFFTPRVVYNHEFVPGENWRLRFNSMTRCMPLYKPAYADISHHVRAFFVPYRTLVSHWNDSIDYANVAYAGTKFAYFTSADVVHSIMTSYGQSGTNTYIDSDTSQFIPCNSDGSEKATDPFPTGKFDFETFRCYEFAGNYVYEKCFVNLTHKGKMLWSMLIGLGYKIDTTFFYENADGRSIPSNWTEDKSAFPLLSLCKVYLDYYLNPRDGSYKLMYERLRDVFLLKVTNLGSDYDSTYHITYLDLIFLALQDVSYSLDYFTSSWENPTAPDNGQIIGGTVFRDPAYEVAPTYINDNFIPFNTISNDHGVGAQLAMNPSTVATTYTNVLSQYLDTALHLVSDKLQRFRLSGMRAVDRYLSTYGVKLKSEYDNRSVYLGKQSSNFTISDVTSTGSESDLAKYKGKAIDYNLNGSFDFEGSEFGFIVLISTVVPRVKYFHGEARHIHHVNRSRFWDPSFDKLAVQAIRADELFAGYQHTSELPSDMNDFVPADHSVAYSDKWAEYKCNPHAIVSGDFVLDHLNTGYRAWHCLREINARYAKLGAEFRSTVDRLQYDRIFENTNGKADGFIQCFNFDVPTSLPMTPMFESYDWCDKKETVTQQTNGSFMN